MKSTTRIKQRLLGVLLILISAAFIGLGLILLLTEKITGFSIVTSGMFLWLGIGFLLLTLNSMRTLEINDDKIIIGIYFGLIRKQYRFSDIVSINTKSFRNKWQTYPGLLIRFRDEQQIHIHEMEFANFRDFQKLITDRIDKYEKLEIEIWTPLAVRFLAFGGLILMGFIIVKLFEM